MAGSSPRSAACASTPRASSRRSAWPGVRRHRRPRRDRIRRPGTLAHAGVDLGAVLRPAPAGRAQHGRGARATTSRPPAAVATATTAHRARPVRRPRSGRARPAGLPPRRQWRNPVMFFGDYYLAHVHEAVDTARVDFGPLPAEGLGARRHAGEAAAPSSSRRSCRRSMGAIASGYGGHLEAHRRPACEPWPRASSRWSRPVSSTTPKWSWLRSAPPARYVRYVVGLLREEGVPVGFVRPITLWPFPSEAVAGSAERARAVCGVRAELRPDVRRRAAGRAPAVHRSSSSAASPSTGPASASPRTSTSTACTSGSATPVDRDHERGGMT